LQAEASTSFLVIVAFLVVIAFLVDVAFSVVVIEVVEVLSFSQNSVKTTSSIEIGSRFASFLLYG
jgi:hypothetical protein